MKPKAPETQVAPLDTMRPQVRNANKHTQRGMGELSDSVQRDGWIGALTVAADGETFDGSARLEVAGSTGFEDAIIVESDGTRPIVVKRTDIPHANDPRAVRLGLAANRAAELNLDFDYDLLSEMFEEGIDLGNLWSTTEISNMLEGAGHALDLDALEPIGAPDAYVRMVQLFFTGEQHAEFLRMTEDLGTYYNTETITDTMLEVVKYAHNKLIQ